MLGEQGRGGDAGATGAGTGAANQVCQRHLSPHEHLGLKVTLSPSVTIMSLASVLKPASRPEWGGLGWAWGCVVSPVPGVLFPGVVWLPRHGASPRLGEFVCVCMPISLHNSVSVYGCRVGSLGVCVSLGMVALCLNLVGWPGAGSSEIVWTQRNVCLHAGKGAMAGPGVFG